MTDNDAIFTSEPHDEPPPPRRRESSDEIPEQLLRWHVVTADEAEILANAAAIDVEFIQVDRFSVDNRADDASHTEDNAAGSIPAQIDPVLVATLSAPELDVNPGATVQLTVGLLNNGERPALFQLHLEGWLGSEWTSGEPVQRQLQPGERADVTIAVSPPRTPASRAGMRAIAVVVKSRDYPHRQTRLPLSLTVAGYDDIRLSNPQPLRLTSSWARPTALATVMVANQGNRRATVRLSGRCIGRPCAFSFRHPQQETQQRDALNFEIEPGETLPVRVALQPERRRLFGLRTNPEPVHFSASTIGKAQVPRTSTALLVHRPLLGPIPVTVLLLSGFLIFFAAVMLGMLGLGLSQLAVARPRPVTPPQPQVVVIVPVNEVVPAPDVAPPSAPLPNGAPMVLSVGGEQPTAADNTDPAARDASLPLIQPDQISGPTTPSASRPADLPPAPARRTDMTYARMFQEIALKYDLDWRILAAQAYVESRFDTLAIGRDGDLGLMQILPQTWKEWAAKVDATDPFDAYSNAVVAAAYLNYVRSLAAGRGAAETQWMLIGYHWGPDKLLTFLDAGSDWETLDPDVRQYAIDVLRIADSIPLD